MKEIIDHKWKCEKCHRFIGEDYEECPICDTNETKIIKKGYQNINETRPS